MKTELEIFNNKKFGKIRTVEINGVSYFVAIDIARALGYKDTTNAIKLHCRWVVKHHIPHPQNPNKRIEVNVIPEGDMYRLITGSELPSAQEFEKWIYDEVLPTLRQIGTYSMNTTCQCPLPPSAFESTANLGRLMERIMKLEGAAPHEIAVVLKTILEQAGIHVPDCFIKLPAYEQLSFPETLSRK